MKFFRPAWSWLPESPIEGFYGFGLPLTECPACKNSKSSSGLTYPWIDLENVFEAKTLRRMKAVKDRGVAGDKDCSWEEFKGYTRILKEKVGGDLPFPPGVRFGPFLGKVYTRPENFVLVDPCRVLVSRSVAQQLDKDGFPLKTFDTKLESKKVTYDYVELWATIVGSSVETKYCSDCERGEIGGTKVPVIRRETIPPDVHLFRLKDALNFIIFSESLVNAILDTGYTGIKFKELQTN